MTDFRTVRGFEDVWRPPSARMIRVGGSGLRARAGAAQSDARARLARIAARAPEVMVKINGRHGVSSTLRAHLFYVTRNGELELEGRDGVRILGHAAVKDLADDWNGAALLDSRRRTNSPLSRAVVLSMPAGTDPEALCDAVRAFAADTLADKYDYVFTLHTDTSSPHVHLAICARGDRGQRLNISKSDLEAWRQTFAQALRDRGVAAEATPRRARGVARKPERTAFRKLRERYEVGKAEIPRARRAALMEAAKTAFQADVARRPWEERLLARQQVVRELYLAQAALMIRSADEADRDLGRAVVHFVGQMPQPDTQRLALARELRAANARAAEGERRPGASPERLRDKER